MAFDPQLAAAVSQTFRTTITLRLSTSQRASFEFLLQSWLGIKNLRNVQLWTREGAVTRNFISRNLGQFEMDLRLLIARSFINNVEPSFPVKRKAWLLPATSETARESFGYLTDNYVSEYITRIFFTEFFFVIEYAADSDTPSDDIDLDSPEFEDLIE